MGKYKLQFITGLVLFVFAGVASAVPAASGKIRAGSTFDTSNAFSFFNNSTPGVSIISLTWDLSPINAFFDSTDDAPGTAGSPLTLSGASDAVGHMFPTNAAQNGLSSLTVSFTNFLPGAAFIFGVDTDLFSAIDATGVNGDQFVGATATAVFSDGSARTGTYVLDPDPIFGTMVGITTPVDPVDPPVSVPEPASMMLLGIGMLGLSAARRKKLV